MLWAVLDPYERYLYERRDGLDHANASMDYFLNEETMREGNPQGVLDRKESTPPLPPTLIIQPVPDRTIPERSQSGSPSHFGRPGDRFKSNGSRRRITPSREGRAPKPTRRWQ